MTQTDLPPSLPVNIPPTLTLTVSHEQFVELALANRDLQLERTATGELIVMPPTGSDTGYRNSDIAGQLWLWNRQNKLGIVFDSSSGFHLPNGSEPRTARSFANALLMQRGYVKTDGMLSV